MVTLQAKERDLKISPKKYREQDLIPAVFYGQGSVATPILVDRVEFIRLYREHGESSIIKLKTPEGEQDVVIKDVQLNPVNERLWHIDFMTIKAGEEMTAYIPLEFIGESAAAKSGLGVLNKNHDEVEVSCLPKDLPHSFTVDLSALETMSDVITVADLDVPEGVEVLLPADEAIASLTGIKEESEEDESTEIDFSQITASKEKDDKESDENEE